MVQHKKKFGIYHWDTFDNETLLIDEANILPEAERKAEKRYGSHISTGGADRVEIVDRAGNIKGSWTVG